MKSQTLHQIYEEVGPRFRFRDVTTLRDYIALSVIRWTINQQPLMMDAVCCEDGMPQTRDCGERRYVLLSSPEEITWLRRLKQERAVKRILTTYTISRLGS